MDLTKVHFLDWDRKLRTSLKHKIIRKFVKYSGLSKDSLYDIYITGSRVYTLYGRKDLFKEDSDLDVAIIVKLKDFYKTFLPVNELRVSRIQVEKLQKENKNKKRAKIKGFKFYGVRVSLFIFSEEYKDLGNFYHYKLPYYSLFQDKYIENNLRHLLDYETHLKGRIMKYEYCFICKRNIESKNSLHLKVIPKEAREIDFELYTQLTNLYICDDCFGKLFTNGTSTFVEKLEKIVSQDDKIRIEPKPQEEDEKKTFFGPL